MLEDQFMANQARKEKEFALCKESYFIKKIFYIILGCSLYATIAFIAPEPLFTFLPIYKSTACYSWQVESGNLDSENNNYALQKW